MSTSVSVCLCTHNGAAHLEAQLASLMSQSRLPDEVVIGDDGSTDGTLEILDRWRASAPSQVSVERRSVSVGHAANLESVLRRARADFIFICDQDDRWHPEKALRLSSALETNPVAGVFSNSALIDEYGSPMSGSLWETLGFSLAEQAAVAKRRGLAVLLRRNVVAGHALAFRRDRVDLLLPFPELNHADWWLAIGLLLDGGLLPLRDKLVDYRLHAGNTVGLRSRTGVADRFGSADAAARSSDDASLIAAVVSRFGDCRPGLLTEEDRALFQGKIAHSLLRGTLPRERLERLKPVAKGLASGGYRRFANGWRSALFDIASSR
jgi:glycosyltransferase involved in cell wall biosynthesis